VGSPLAKHVPLVLTVLLVPQVVLLWIQLLVVLEPMPVVLRAFVMHVLLGNTTINKDKRHVRPVLTIRLPILAQPQGHPRVLLVPLASMLKVDNPLAFRFVLRALSVHNRVLVTALLPTLPPAN